MDKTILTEIIESLSKKLKAYYVFPNIAEEICDHLQQHLNEGVYAEIVDDELPADILYPEKISSNRIWSLSKNPLNPEQLYRLSMDVTR